MSAEQLLRYAAPGLLTVLIAACSTTRPAKAGPFDYAYLQRDSGVQRVELGESRTAPGTEAAETFTWSRDGDGFLITHGGTLETVDAAGGRSPLLSGYLALRFPDVNASDGKVLVAATRTSTTKGPWHVLLLPAHGGPPEDLGLGYDPCFLGSRNAILLEDHGSTGSAIYLLDLDTRVRRQLAVGHTPSVAADERTVYYSSAGQLWSLAVDEPTAAPIALTPPGSYDRFASVSNDGNSLLFFRQAEGANLIVERDLRTGEERQVGSGHLDLPQYRPRDTWESR